MFLFCGVKVKVKTSNLKLQDEKVRFVILPQMKVRISKFFTPFIELIRKNVNSTKFKSFENVKKFVK